MSRVYILLLTSLLLSCGKDSATADAQLDSSALFGSGASPFADYYTHPEIRDIGKLRELLLTADKVIAANFNGHRGNSANQNCEDLFAVPGGKMCSESTFPIVLNNKQIDSLIAITCDTTTYSGEWSGLAGVCFIPHLGFAFFHGDSLIAQVNICFLCSGIRTRPYYCSDMLTRKGGYRYVQLAEELGLEIVDGSTDLSY